MTVKLRLCNLISILLLLSQISVSQTHYTEEFFTSGNSASTNNISSILIDKGKIWIGSFDGLQEFDGYSFKQYDSPAYNDIPTDLLSIIKDKNGNIWCCNFEAFNELNSTHLHSRKKHISIFNPNLGETIRFEDYIDTSLIGDYATEIMDLYQDHNKDIWILTNDGNAYNYSTKLTQTHFKNLQRHDRIFPIQDKYYYLKQDSILEYNSNITCLKRKYYKGHYAKIEIGPDSLLYVTGSETRNNKQVYLGRIANEKIVNLTSDISNAQYLSHNFEKAVAVNFQNLTVKDLASGELKKLDLSDLTPCRIPKILNSKNIYTPSSTGILHLSSNTFPFEIIKSTPNESNRFMFLLNDTTLLYSSYSGAKTQNLNTKIITDFSNDYFFGMTRLPGNKYLIGSGGQVFTLIDKLEKNEIRVTNLSDNTPIYMEYRIPFYDKLRDQIWLGTENALRILRDINTNNNTVTTIPSKYTIEGIKCFFLKGDTLSIGTTNGLYEIYKDNSLKKIDNADYFIYDLERTKDGTYYIATQQNGFVILKNDNVRIELSESAGISDKTVYSFEVDKEGFIWAGTQNGLNMINLHDYTIQHYFKENGISNNEFNYTSTFQNEEGRMFFGSVDGIIGFMPNEIRNKRLNNLTQIDIIEVKSWNPTIQEFVYNSYTPEQKLEVDANSRSVKLKLSLGNISLLRENLFQYRIPGIIDQWRNIPENTVTLTNLPSGDHDLYIRTKSYLSEQLVIPIFVKNYFYYSWWFILLAFALPVIALRYYIQRKDKINLERQKELEKQVHSRTLELVNKTLELEISTKSKDQIISILAHDLRSPLLSLNDVSDKISYLIEKDRTEDLKALGKDINKKTHNIQRLVDNMLHWAVLQSGGKNSVINSFNIDGPLTHAIELYIDIAKAKNITIEYNKDQDIILYSDLNIFQTVIRNLLDNAIKYSPKNSMIRIKCTTTETTAVISVIDQGKGIEKDKIDLLNTAELNDPIMMTKAKGTGLGLSICKHLLTDQSQDLWYTANQPEGSIFSFTQNLCTKKSS